MRTIEGISLDNRSFRLNFEITAIVIDRDFTAELERVFLTDVAGSRRMMSQDVAGHPFWFRAAARAAYMLAPVL